MTYREWAWELITIITNDKRVSPEIKVEEIKCALRKDVYLHSYEEGDTPEESWLGEFEALSEV